MKNKLLTYWQYVSHHVLFPKQLEFGIYFLRLFGDTHKTKHLQKSLSSLAENTIGKRLYNLLKNRGLELVPFYEEHDLKHAILGYSMEATDEMLMQAFMAGNDFKFTTNFIALFFVIWTPEIWFQIPHHFKIGRKCKPIGHYKVRDLIHRDLEQFRTEIGFYEAIK
jgi:hypothetical protein